MVQHQGAEAEKLHLCQHGAEDNPFKPTLLTTGTANIVPGLAVEARCNHIRQDFVEHPSFEGHKIPCLPDGIEVIPQFSQRHIRAFAGEDIITNEDFYRICLLKEQSNTFLLGRCWGNLATIAN